jgi:hypothetical protein
MLRLFSTIAVVGGSLPLADRRSAALFKVGAEMTASAILAAGSLDLLEAL